MTRFLRTLSLVCCAIFLMRSNAKSQETNSLYYKILHFPDKLFNQVEEKTTDVQDRLVKQTEKYLQRLSREEEKLRKKLAKKNFSAAEAIFGDAATQYSHFQNQIQNQAGKVDKFRNRYIPHLDSLQTAFRFLQQTDSLTGDASKMSGKVKDILANMDGLQVKFNQAEEIKSYLKQRRAFLQDQLSRYGLTKELKKFKKEVYYYQAQVEEYKAMFDDPSRLESKAIELLSKTSLFQKFFANNSQLAGMFRLPGASSYNSQPTAFAGLQGRDAIQHEIRQRFGSNVNVNQMVQQQAHNTQLLDKWKAKIIELGNGSIGNARTDIEMPDFKVNNQKVKSFRDRLEVGTNLQTVKSNQFFPTTSDIGFSIGFKLNDKSILGIGSSYKMGWGKDIRHILITHQGVGLRSFLDYKVKGSFFIAGGYEQNYRTLFNSVDQLKDKRAWQSSGLIGVSKKYSVSKKLKGNVQVLWDFLSYQQVPRTQAVLFRVGYGLK